MEVGVEPRDAGGFLKVLYGALVVAFLSPDDVVAGVALRVLGLM